VVADKSEFCPLPIHTIENQLKPTMQTLGLPADAVVHSFRYTFGARLGKADALTIMQAMDISSVIGGPECVNSTP
jgi:hypothetical protein